MRSLHSMLGDIPSFKVFETDLSFVLPLDTNVIYVMMYPWAATHSWTLALFPKGMLWWSQNVILRFDSEASMLTFLHGLDHAEKMHELPDEHLSDVLPIAKKIAIAQGVPDYNILQNNGRLAHQVITIFFVEIVALTMWKCNRKFLMSISTLSLNRMLTKAWVLAGLRNPCPRKRCRIYLMNSRRKLLLNLTRPCKFELSTTSIRNSNKRENEYIQAGRVTEYCALAPKCQKWLKTRNQMSISPLIIERSTKAWIKSTF